ncbi:hypothetical protein EDB84DRAFT_1620279 [Lactarius hengduanensis]|nr:hypothetical protein EDB84DRAFT_1620279 [Lactarius hengduanensis]
MCATGHVDIAQQKKASTSTANWLHGRHHRTHATHHDAIACPLAPTRPDWRHGLGPFYRALCSLKPPSPSLPRGTQTRRRGLQPWQPITATSGPSSPPPTYRSGLQPIAAASDPSHRANAATTLPPHGVEFPPLRHRRRPTWRGTTTTDAEGDDDDTAGATAARATVVTRRGRRGGLVAARRHS